MKILIVAYSGQGHINPTLQFAKRILKTGVHVTFCTTVHVINRIRDQTTHQNLTYAPFSDGHDGKQPDTDLCQLVSDFDTSGARAVSEILTSADDIGDPFDHLVYTTVAPWASLVATRHRVRSTVLWCQSATVLNIYHYYFNGFRDLISTNYNNPSFSINLPRMPPLTTLDLPSFFSPSSPKELDFILTMFKQHVEVLETNPRILVNTFNELEFESVKAIESLEMFSIGPLLPSAFLDGDDVDDTSFGGDLFDQTEADYVRWLNTKPKSSVVYVSFGSFSMVPNEQLEEISVALLATGRPFLWVIPKGIESADLSRIEELKTQGMIVTWCRQLEVLNHGSIGCFVTHCGWNSTLEAIVAGVATVVMSQWSDQGTNGKMVEDVWKTGVRARKKEDGLVEGKEIERCLEMVMGGGEEGEEVRRNAEKWKVLAKEAVNNGGSSAINLQAFLDDV